MAPRLHVLLHPLMAASLLTLALNDHWLKHAHPSWVTGKLSDVAGVIVVAFILTALGGDAAKSCVLTALGFGAIKLSTHMASLVAPLLGGTTRTDATDLVALGALVPAFLALRRAAGTASAASIVRFVGSMMMLTLAVPVITATGCVSEPIVDELVVVDDSIWAAVRGEVNGLGPPDPTVVRWAVSADGGQNWQLANSSPLETDQPPVLEACASTGVCWRVIRGQRIEQRANSALGWRTSFAFSGIERDRISNVAACGQDRVEVDTFRSLAIIEHPNDRSFDVVVAMGAQGVLHLDRAGVWHRRPVLETEPTDLEPSIAGIALPAWLGHILPVFATTLLLWVVAGAIALPQPARRRWWLWPIVGFAGAMAGAMIGVVVELVSQPRELGGLLMVAVALFALAAAPLLRRSRRVSASQVNRSKPPG